MPGQVEEMTVEERHDRLQEAWLALNQIHAHLHQDGYEIDLDEKRLEASRAVGEVIRHYQQHEGVDAMEMIDR